MRILVRLFVATIFFVLVAAAVITVLESRRGLYSDQTEAEGNPSRVASQRTALPGTDTIASSVARPRRGASASQAPSLAPGIGNLPPAFNGRSGLRSRLTASTPVYSSSSSASQLLTELGKDGQFETGVTILNEDGLWLEVRLNQNTYGFVRGDDLDVN